MERSLGCPTLEHQVYLEREVGPATGMQTRTLCFGQAAGLVKAIQGNTVLCTQKSKVQSLNTAGRQSKMPGIENRAKDQVLKDQRRYCSWPRYILNIGSPEAVTPSL